MRIIGYVEAKNRRRLTKDGECGRIKAGSREDCRWLPGVTDDLCVVEGRDSVRDQVRAVIRKVSRHEMIHVRANKPLWEVHSGRRSR